MAYCSGDRLCKLPREGLLSEALMITKPLLLRVLCHTCSQIYLVWKHQGRLSQHAPFHVKNWAFQTGEEFCYGAGNWCVHMAWHKKELYPTEIIGSCPAPLGWSLFFFGGLFVTYRTFISCGEKMCSQLKQSVLLGMTQRTKLILSTDTLFPNSEHGKSI